MKTERLTLNNLHLEMELVEENNLISIKGGTNPGTGVVFTPITDYLSAFFGQEVTSSVDAAGNWVISIGGGPPIPLTFQLNEVNITASGHVTNNNGSSIFDGWVDWLGASFTQYISGGGGSNGGIGGGGSGGNQSNKPTVDIIVPDNVHPDKDISQYGPLTVTTFTLSAADAYNFFGNMETVDEVRDLAIGLVDAPYLAAQLYALAQFYAGSNWGEMQDTLINSHYQGNVLIEGIDSLSPTGGIAHQFIIKLEDGTTLGYSSY